MLPAGTTEDDQNIRRRIGSACDRDFPDRGRHAFVGNRHTVLGQRDLGRSFGSGDRSENRRRCLTSGFAIDRNREVGRFEPAKKEVAVGDCQRSAATVARRPGVGARTLGSDEQTHTVPPTDRPAAGGHGLDRERWRGDPHTRLLRFELAGDAVGPVDAADIGARAAHIQRDRAGRSRGCFLRPIAWSRFGKNAGQRGLGRDNPAGRPGEHTATAAKRGRRDERSLGCHQREPRPG